MAEIIDGIMDLSTYPCTHAKRILPSIPAPSEIKNIAT